MTPAPAAPDRAGRYDRLDALRAFAMLWMAGFHFAFDLAYFGYLHTNFYLDPKWTLQRTCIVTLFLFCAGFGQAIAHVQGQRWPRFWRRWAQVAGAAVLVSAGSYLVFPHSYIYFGVLHGIAVMLLVMRVTAGRSVRTLMLLGLAAMLLPLAVSHPFFDNRWTNWVGLVTHKPITEDYVPVLPWLGPMWWGLAVGKWTLGRRPLWVGGVLPTRLHPLATLGRFSLSFYVLHQPVLFGAVAGFKAILESAR